jgi:hypothetical protein
VSYQRPSPPVTFSSVRQTHKPYFQAPNIVRRLFFLIPHLQGGLVTTIILRRLEWGAATLGLKPNAFGWSGLVWIGNMVGRLGNIVG